MKQVNDLSSIDLAPLRRDNIHNSSKGDFGYVGIVGGAYGMVGAPIISARAAMRAGAGKVMVGFIAASHPLFDTHYPELMLSSYQNILATIERFNVLLIGVGLGVDSLSLQVLSQLLDILPQTNCQLVFDADALNLIAEYQSLQHKFIALKHKIITPHPLEAARLLKSTAQQVQSQRYESVLELSRHYNAVSLLKGYHSLITDGSIVYENQSGSSAMSNAGQGDLLSGLIAAFIAQGMTALLALRFAVYVHGLASDQLVKKHSGYNGIIASDSVEYLTSILNSLIYT